MGGIDQLERGVEIAVVIVADFGDQEAGGVIADAVGADLEPIGGAAGHGHDAAMAVEQRQRNDAGIEQSTQITGAGALGGRAAVGIHGRGDRAVQVDLAAAGNPAAEVTVGENALEDAAFRDNKISLDWLAVILLSADRMLSSAKTTNWVKFRSIRMPLTVLFGRLG